MSKIEYSDLEVGDRVAMKLMAFKKVITEVEGSITEKLDRGLIVKWDRDASPTRVTEAEHFWERGLLKHIN